MGSKALERRVAKLKALEEQKEAIEKQMEALKEEIKQDMEAKGEEELEAGNFLIRWKTVLSNRFDTKAFAKEHETLYIQYVKQTESKRFTIA